VSVLALLVVAVSLVLAACAPAEPRTSSTRAAAGAPAAAAPARPQARSHTPALLGCAVQRSSLRLCGARTDNYKDCYNEPDGRTETRSWLSYGELSANGARYRKLAGAPQFGTSVAVQRIRGNRRMPARAYVTVRALTGNVALLNLRVGPPDKLWGPLLQLADPDDLASGAVRLEVRLQRSNGKVVARTPLSYRRDAALAEAAAGTPEHDGPAGRWYVAGLRTSTDVELGAHHVCP
jgi:hypothetical protein